MQGAFKQQNMPKVTCGICASDRSGGNGHPGRRNDWVPVQPHARRFVLAAWNPAETAGLNPPAPPLFCVWIIRSFDFFLFSNPPLQVQHQGFQICKSHKPCIYKRRKDERSKEDVSVVTVLLKKAQTEITVQVWFKNFQFFVMLKEAILWISIFWTPLLWCFFCVATSRMHQKHNCASRGTVCDPSMQVTTTARPMLVLQSRFVYRLFPIVIISPPTVSIVFSCPF